MLLSKIVWYFWLKYTTKILEGAKIIWISVASYLNLQPNKQLSALFMWNKLNEAKHIFMCQNTITELKMFESCADVFVAQLVGCVNKRASRLWCVGLEFESCAHSERYRSWWWLWCDKCHRRLAVVEAIAQGVRSSATKWSCCDQEVVDSSLCPVEAAPGCKGFTDLSCDSPDAPVAQDECSTRGSSCSCG